MIGLQLISGVDDHVGSEDAYLRMIRARRWLIAVSALLYLTSAGFFASSGLRAPAQYLDIPAQPLRWTLAAVVVYLGAQYVIVLGQLFLSYKYLLRERLIRRHEEALLQQQVKIEELEAEYGIAREEVLRALDDKEAELNSVARDAHQALIRARQAHSDAEANFRSVVHAGDQEAKISAERLVSDRYSLMETARGTYSDVQTQRGAVAAERTAIEQHPRLRAIAARQRTASLGLEALNQGNPKGSKAYRVLESIGDWMRAFLPLAFAVGALGLAVVARAPRDIPAEPDGSHSASITPAPETAPPPPPTSRLSPGTSSPAG